MNDAPRLKLIALLDQERDLLDNPRRLEGLLKDYCGEHKREIHSLMDALRERVPADLLTAPGGTPAAVLIGSLTKRLIDNRPMAEDIARWAVETWALALKVISAPLPPPPAPQPAPTPAPPPAAQAAPKPHAHGTPRATPPAHQPAAQVPPRPTPTPAARSAPKGGVQTFLARLRFEPILMRVPEGEFWMGSTIAQVALAVQNGAHVEQVRCEQPEHEVWLPAYEIGKYPVTCSEYQAFLQNSGHRPPPGWQGSHYPANKGEYPVVNVSWHDAVAYCAWLGQQTGRAYRLPSEAEWEKAARGADRRLYPWGDMPQSGRANTQPGVRDTAPVGRFSPQGDSPYGCADMVGNVWEWCADWFDEKAYATRTNRVTRDPRGPASGVWRVCRGGSWQDKLENARCAFRMKDYPDHLDPFTGFRVCVPLS